MRLLILSDIHANIAALRAIEKDAGAVDAIYCAGDYVDYGTDPHEAIGWATTTDICSTSCFRARWMRFGEQIATNGCTTTANG